MSRAAAGGWTNANSSVNEDVKKVAEAVKEAIEKNTGKTYSHYEVVAYKTQIVAGVNYFLKIKVGDADYVHAKVWAKLDRSHELTTVEGGKKESDDL